MTALRHGAIALLGAHEIVARRMIMADETRAPAARISAAEWLAENGGNSDRVRANAILDRLCGRARRASHG